MASQMKVHRPLVLPLLSLALLVHAPPSSARYYECRAPLPMTLNMPSARVLSNLAVGQTIPGASIGFSVAVTCTNPTLPTNPRWVISARGVYATATSSPDVFAIGTGTSGIGFRVRNAAGVAQTGQRIGSDWHFDMAPATPTGATVAGTIELVKTSSTVVSGPGSMPFDMHIPDYQFANQSTAGSIMTVSYTVAAIPTCTATVPSMQVRLPTVSRSSLSALNATSARTPFNLGLTCDANAAPTVVLSDSTTPANGTDRLSLTAASTASGVAIQVLSTGQPVVFSSSASPGSGTVIRPASPATAGQVNIPLEVQYIRNSSSISPGTVNAIATFTLGYP